MNQFKENAFYKLDGGQLNSLVKSAKHVGVCDTFADVSQLADGTTYAERHDARESLGDLIDVLREQGVINNG